MKGVNGTRKKNAAEIGALILLDQQPLRRRVANACTDLMARLSVVRGLWHQFDREDKPAYIRWRAREFGALLSRAREVENQIRDAQALIHEVEKEMRRQFQNPYTAYQRVMFRREHPAEALEEEEPVKPARGGHAKGKVTDFEAEALFQEWVQRFLGTNPDKMDDEAYKTTFEKFKSHMFIPAAEKRAPQPSEPPRQKAEPLPELHEEAEAEEKDAAIDARLKSLYRKLVRRLHPDHRDGGGAEVSALWHEVQEAYAAGDVARMEILLALSNIEGDALADDTTLFEMGAVHTELQRSLVALEKSVREAEGDEAWNFARIGPSDDLRLRIERELKHQLGQRLQHLDLLTRTISDWETGPEINAKVRVVHHYR